MTGAGSRGSARCDPGGARRRGGAETHLHVRPRAEEGVSAGLRSADDGLEQERRRVALVLLDEAPVREDGRELVVEDATVERDEVVPLRHEPPVLVRLREGVLPGADGRGGGGAVRDRRARGRHRPERRGGGLAARRRDDDAAQGLARADRGRGADAPARAGARATRRSDHRGRRSRGTADARHACRADEGVERVRARW